MKRYLLFDSRQYLKDMVTGKSRIVSFIQTDIERIVTKKEMEILKAHYVNNNLKECESKYKVKEKRLMEIQYDCERKIAKYIEKNYKLNRIIPYCSLDIKRFLEDSFKNKEMLNELNNILSKEEIEIFHKTYSLGQKNKSIAIRLKRNTQKITSMRAIAKERIVGYFIGRYIYQMPTDRTINEIRGEK